MSSTLHSSQSSASALPRVVNATDPSRPTSDRHVGENTAPLLDTRQPYSLASVALAAHGVRDGRPVVVLHNYTTAANHGDALTPVHLAKDNGPEFPMAFLPIANAGAGETVLALTLPKGQIGYLQANGILDPSTKVIEVNPEVSGHEKLGFPYTDVLSLARKQGVRLPEDAHVVVTFPSDFSRAQVEALGGHPVQGSNALLTNNKFHFKSEAQRYGVQVTPWMPLNSTEQVMEAAVNFRDEARVWIKLDRGAGGDNVVPIKGPVSVADLLGAIDKFKEHVRAAFKDGQYGEGALEAVWPEDAQFPTGLKMFIEQDVRALGEIIHDLSNSFIIDKDGRVQTVGYYCQRTTEDGTFLGSVPIELPVEIRELVDQQTARMGAMCRDLGMYGFAGLDVFIVKTPSGELQAYVTEMNGRPSSSQNSMCIADRLGYGHWINCTLEAPGEVSCIDDIRQLYWKNGGVGDPFQRHNNDACALVLSLSTLQTRDASGEIQTVKSSRTFRALIASNQSSEECEALLTKLAQHGFVVSH